MQALGNDPGGHTPGVASPPMAETGERLAELEARCDEQQRVLDKLVIFTQAVWAGARGLADPSAAPTDHGRVEVD